MFQGQVTEPEIVVSFTHNTVGDLPGIMQETELSPLQSLACRFVSQFVPAVKEVERDRRMKSETMNPKPPSVSAHSQAASQQNVDERRAEERRILEILTSSV